MKCTAQFAIFVIQLSLVFAGFHFDTNNAMASMSQIMARAQKGMRKAQAERSKAVTTLRTAAALNLDHTAAEIGQALGEYAGEAAMSERDLEAALNASQLGLAKASQDHTWNPTLSHQRGHLRGEVSAAKQVLLHARHQDKQELRAAKEKASGILEGETLKMDQKLGDLSPVLKHSEETLEEHVAEATAAVVDAPANATLSASPGLDALQKDLEAAEARRASLGAAAKKRLEDALASAGVELSAEDAKVLQHIDAGHVQALSGVFSHALEAAAAASPIKKK